MGGSAGTSTLAAGGDEDGPVEQAATRAGSASHVLTRSSYPGEAVTARPPQSRALATLHP